MLQNGTYQRYPVFKISALSRFAFRLCFEVLILSAIAILVFLRGVFTFWSSASPFLALRLHVWEFERVFPVSFRLVVVEKRHCVDL